MGAFVEPFSVETGCTIQDKLGIQYRVGARLAHVWWHGNTVLFHVTRLDTGEVREINRRIIWEVCTLVAGPPEIRHRSRNVARHRERKVAAA